MKTFQQYLVEAIKNDELDWDKPWVVYRTFKEYGEVIEIPMKTFDTEKEAEAFADNEYSHSGPKDMDQFVVKEVK